MSRRRLQGCEVMPPMETSAKPARRAAPGRGHGRFQVLNAFVDVSMREVGGTAIKMWLALYRDTKENGLAKASDTDLARRCGVSSRTIQEARKELVATGLIEVVRRGSLTIGPSTYRVHASITGSPLPVTTGKRPRSLRKKASGIPDIPRRRADPAGSHAPKPNTAWREDHDRAGIARRTRRQTAAKAPQVGLPAAGTGQEPRP